MNYPINELRRLASAGKVAMLDPTERAVVVLRLGWDRAESSRSQAEVAEMLGLSQPTVSITERQAKDKLEVFNDSTKWFQSHDTLLALATWLVDRSEFENQSDLLYFWEKPWKWETEYQEYLGACAAADAAEAVSA